MSNSTQSQYQDKIIFWIASSYERLKLRESCRYPVNMRRGVFQSRYLAAGKYRYRYLLSYSKIQKLLIVGPASSLVSIQNTI
jgi:hypothetical protein